MSLSLITCRGYCIDPDDTHYKQWVYGYYFHQFPRKGVFGQAITKLDFETDYIIDLQANHKRYEIDPASLGRFTGAYDFSKSPQPIFEGDLLEKDGRYGLVVWIAYGWYLEFIFNKSHQVLVPFKDIALDVNSIVIDNYIVVGNRYEYFNRKEGTMSDDTEV